MAYLNQLLHQNSKIVVPPEADVVDFFLVMHIRKMTQTDWPEVSKIYTEGIATGFATFETEVPSYESWHEAHIEECRFVAEVDKDVLGWVALTPVSSRCVYGGVAEVSVYIAENARGKGVGKSLMKKLITASESSGYWTLQSGIFPENRGSIILHEKVGFRFLGKRERVAKNSNGVWTDNLLFERRSTIIGV